MKEDNIFKFLDNEKTTCEFNGISYDVLTCEEKREKYFIDDKQKKYFILENQVQLLIRFEKKDYNFKRCIFLFKAYFFGDIEKEIRFNNAIFNEDVDFSSVQFKESSIFLRTIFKKRVSFKFSKFYQVALFDCSKFEGEVSFYEVDFLGSNQLMQIKCEKNFYISNCRFEEDIQLNAAEFKEDLLFNDDITIKKRISFYKSKMKNLLFCNIKTSKDFSITLRYSQIEKMDYEGTDFTKADDRETFLILKEFALKKHDQVNALEFFKKEMETYRSILKKEKNIDYLILSFESKISEFGTNPIVPLVSIILIAFVFSFFVSYSVKDCSIYLETSFLLMNPTLSIKNIIEIVTDTKAHMVISPAIEIINFFKNLFFGVLIYESIKSFRKFSRKL